MNLPSRTKLMQWFCIAALLFFAISTLGKQQFPAFFTIGWVGWIYRIYWGANTIIVPLGFVLSLGSLFSNEMESKVRRDAGGKAWCFLLIFCFSVFTQVHFAFSINGIIHKLNEFPENEMNLKIISKIPVEKSAAKRVQLAASLYRYAGIVIPYQLDDGSYVSFQPTAKDNEEWAKNRKVNTLFKSQQQWVYSSVQQILENALAEIAVFFVIVSGGILKIRIGLRRKVGANEVIPVI